MTRRKHNRPLEVIAKAGKNPPAVDFSAEFIEGETFADELHGILEDANDQARAVSWMMNAIARARANDHAGYTRAEVAAHMARVEKQTGVLLDSLENPLWWDLLIPDLSADELRAIGYWWTDGRPESPENVEKARWRMIEATMLDRLTLLASIRTCAGLAAKQADPKGKKQAPRPAVHSLAREICEGIDNDILPFSGPSDMLAQDLFKVACRAAGLSANKPLSYYAK